MLYIYITNNKLSLPFFSESSRECCNTTIPILHLQYPFLPSEVIGETLSGYNSHNPRSSERLLLYTSSYSQM